MTYLLQNDVSEDDIKKFKKTCTNVYVVIVSSLQKSFPLDSTVLKDVPYLHPDNRHGTNSLSSISRLCLSVLEPLKSVLNSAFPRPSEQSAAGAKEDMCDDVRNESGSISWTPIFRLFRERLKKKAKVDSKIRIGDVFMKNMIWRSFLLMRNHQGKGHRLLKFRSLWQRRIDEYWDNVSKMADVFGKPNYACLSSLVKCVLTLSHGNSVPESGFSLNKSILNFHRCSLDEKMTVSLCTIK